MSMSPREHYLERWVGGYLVVEWARQFLDYKKRVMKLSGLVEEVEDVILILILILWGGVKYGVGLPGHLCELVY